MRFLHLSDLHLGKRVCEFSMLDDQRYILEEILSLLDTRPVDAVLLAGDLYDKPVPPAEAVRLLDWFLTELADRKLPRPGSPPADGHRTRPARRSRGCR